MMKVMGKTFSINRRRYIIEDEIIDVYYITISDILPYITTCDSTKQNFPNRSAAPSNSLQFHAVFGEI